jgi:hypothetical protein
MSRQRKASSCVQRAFGRGERRARKAQETLAELLFLVIVGPFRYPINLLKRRGDLSMGFQAALAKLSN